MNQILRFAPVKTGKEHKPPGNIHRQQLFYWMGGSLDKQNRHRRVFNDELTRECLKLLRGSLENGLWVKSPRVPERFDFKGNQFCLDAPICCFTEWALGESLPHTAEYGRMGFGFPKRWVIERGGQSVTYFRHSEKGIFLQCAFKLLTRVGEHQGEGLWKARPGISGFEELRYLLHFAKMIRLKKPEVEKKAVARVARAARRLGARQPPKAATDAWTFRRKFGQPLQFVEEREWRIVHHPTARGFVKGPGIPDYYLPYVPGEELFTLVLPDNKVMFQLLQNDWFTERLFTPWKHYKQLNRRRVPPVTLLSHSDIGTF